MKILFVSLGCDKNLVDSEEMLWDLAQAGYEITDDEEEAQAAVVNTCCFINDAKKESIESILELGARRESGQLRALIVTGCMAQRYSREIREEIPEVDAVIGTTAQETLLQTLEEVLAGMSPAAGSAPESGQPAETGEHTEAGRPAETGEHAEAGRPAEQGEYMEAGRPDETGEHAEAGQPAEPGAGDSKKSRPEAGADVSGSPVEREVPLIIRLNDLRKMPRADGKRLLTTPNGSAYLRIAEGCSKHCTYCVIPSIRGPFRSLPMEQVLRTAGELAEQGVQELILVAQETTLYGTDIYGEKKLPELLHALSAIRGIRWIRLLYCYPEEITPELVRTIREEPKVLHYIDMPVQHASDDILRKMGRRTDRKELEEKIALLRREIPDICIRTTLITGFPGETEKDHRTLKAFVKKMKFDRLGVFAYSREEGTPAAKMPSQVPAPVKNKRRRELMLLQQEIAFRNARRMRGKTLEAVVEGKIVGEDVYTARTYMDAPGVDGTLFIETGRELMTGDFLMVKVTGSDQYDLIGVPAGE